MWLWSVVVAWAAPVEPVGFWHPDDLAPLSVRYRTTSDALREGPFGERSTRLAQVATALQDYREALDLLGAKAPAAERARLDDLERQFARENATLQAFADALVGDYDREFRAAVDRALAKKGAVEECPATVQKGPPLPGVPSKPNPDCHGKNLNEELARAVDGDKALEASLDALLAREWPTITVSAAAQAPVGGAERWIAVRDLVRQGAADRLTVIRREDDDQRTEIEAAIESGASADDLKKLEPRAKEIEAATAAKRAALAAPMLAAADATMAKKWSGEPATGWCANPALLGGCTGEDQTKALVPRLMESPQMKKALR